MPPRRPLVGGKGSADRFAGVPAPAAQAHSLGKMTAIKGGHSRNHRAFNRLLEQLMK